MNSQRTRKNPPSLGKPDYYFSIVRREVLDLIEQNNLSSEKILEIGCAGGATGRLLKESGLVKEYIGVEISESAAVMARQYLDRVIVADIERVDLEKEHGIRKEYFDLILCLDVLEHLYDPWEVVARLKDFLKFEGHLIASLPNVQNIIVIKNLVDGRWQYEGAGILDATHLRFFALQDMIDMFEGAGLSVVRIDRIFNPLPDLSKLKDKGNYIDFGNIIIKDLSRDQVLNLFTYQFFIIAKKPLSEKPSINVNNNISDEIDSKVLPDSKLLTTLVSTNSQDMVSIVILTFNQLEYTKRCVESIR